MGAQSKTHHFLPQFILRGFALRDQVSTVDLVERRSYLQSSSKAAAENHYNSIDLDDGTKTDIAEKLIANEIETPASSVLQRIAGGGWLANESELRVLARFLVLQYLRVPWRRAESDAMADQLLKLELAAGGPN